MDRYAALGGAIGLSAGIAYGLITARYDRTSSFSVVYWGGFGWVMGISAGTTVYLVRAVVIRMRKGNRP